MLVLSRKVGQAIVIGEDVTISVVRVRGGQVAIAIDAPRSVGIRRSELERLPHDSKSLVKSNPK